MFNRILFLREELSASLPGTQSQSQSSPDALQSSNASHLWPISGGHPCPSIHASYSMDNQSRQSSTAPRLKYNQHVADFRSPSGTEHLARLQLSQILPHPPNTSESLLHSHNSDANHNQPPVPISSRPRSRSATALLPPYIPKEHALSYTTKTLRRTSFSNLQARESHDGHDGHQHTGVVYPSSLSTQAGSSFSIGRSAVKYHDHDLNMHFDDEGYHPSSHDHHNLHQMSSYAIQKPLLNIYDKRVYNRYSIPLSLFGQFDQTPSCDGFIGWTGNACKPMLWNQIDLPLTRSGLLRLLCHLIHIFYVIRLMTVVRSTLTLKVSTISLIISSFFYPGCMEPPYSSYLIVSTMKISLHISFE